MSFYRFEKPLQRKTTTRVCPGCGVLLDAADSRCFQCGTLVSPSTFPGARLWLKRRLTLQGQVTFSLLIMNFVFFFLTWLLSSDKSGFMMNIDLRVLNRFGAKNTMMIANGQVWRLLVAAFLHGNLMHIFFNMMALLSLGRLVEEFYGWQLYLFFYVMSGLLGNLASAWYYPDVLGIGASGAIMGLAGVLIALSLKNWKVFGPFIGRGLLRWVAYILLIGFFLSGYVDNAAHVGGLLAGFLLSLPFSISKVRSAWRTGLENAAGWGSAMIICASFTAMAFSH